MDINLGIVIDMGIVFFCAIIWGIFYKKMNRQGVISGMLAGIALTLSYIVFFKFISPELSTSENRWFGINPEKIGTLGMCLNFVIALLLDKQKPCAFPLVRSTNEEAGLFASH